MHGENYCSDVLLNFIENISGKFDSVGSAADAFRRELLAVLAGMHVSRVELKVVIPPPGEWMSAKPAGGPPNKTQGGPPAAGMQGGPPGPVPGPEMQRVLHQPPVVDAMVLYEDGTFGEETVSEKLSSEVGADMEAVIYAVQGYHFSEYEKRYARFLLQMVFHVVGRSQVMGLLNNARVTDMLTGVPNAIGLKTFMGRTVAMHKQGAYTAAFLNFKDFKYINQRVGMPGGNIILRYFIRSVEQLLVHGEDIASRLGGDNFFLFIRDERVEAVKKRLRNFMLDFGEAEPLSMRLEVRMGIYKCGAEDSVLTIMDNANTAMVLTRDPERSLQVSFQPEMREKEFNKKELGVVFPTALKNREFTVFYQPKVNLHQRRLCGAEALVRWQRNGIIVPPMKFIPALEEDGRIRMLDFYVFEQMCRDQADWIARGLSPVKISANFSRQHLVDRDCANHILRILERYNIPNSLVEIELTETLGIEDFERMNEFVRELAKADISVSIDDFGAGYSSLNLLKDLSVDVIKLDQSFVRTIEQPRSADHIVLKNIISLVNDLGMEVIAEGVETKTQAGFLADLNCSMGQGYLFDKPLPHDMFEERLQDKDCYLKR